MAKWYGKIGFTTFVETAPGVSSERVVELDYRGDVLNNTRRREAGEYLNDDVKVQIQIEIISDAYATENFHMIRFAEYMGAMWKVVSAVVERPRIKLTLGGLYNGKRGPKTNGSSESF